MNRPLAIRKKLAKERHTSTLICALLLTLSAQACRSVDAGAYSDVQIAGGRTVSSNERVARHTVALIETSPAIDSFCTGVMIAPDLVLTAARCFKQRHKKPFLYFGTKLPSTVDSKDPALVAIKRVMIHPDFDSARLDALDAQIAGARELSDPEFAINDLALISFEKSPPESYEPVTFAAAGVDLSKSRITSAGFGCLSTECDQASNRLRKVSMKWVRTVEKKNFVILSAGSGKGACAGDGGGPDFIEGGEHLQLLSIVDTGPDSCESGLSLDTLVSPYAEWIRDSAQKIRH